MPQRTVQAFCLLLIHPAADEMIFMLFMFMTLELYEKDFNGQSAIYWEVKYPFPMSNRDVSFPPLPPGKPDR